MEDMTLEQVIHLNKVFGLVLYINDGIISDYTYEEV